MLPRAVACPAPAPGLPAAGAQAGVPCLRGRCARRSLAGARRRRRLGGSERRCVLATAVMKSADPRAGARAHATSAARCKLLARLGCGGFKFFAAAHGRRWATAAELEVGPSRRARGGRKGENMLCGTAADRLQPARFGLGHRARSPRVDSEPRQNKNDLSNFARRLLLTILMTS